MRFPSGYRLTHPRMVNGQQAWGGVHIAWWRQAIDYCRGIQRVFKP